MKLLTFLTACFVFLGMSGSLTAQILGGGTSAGDNGIAIDGTVSGDVVTGGLIDCSEQLAASVIENSTVSVYVANCEGPERLNVQYFWMDLDAASIILSGTIPSELHGVFGSQPSVLQTEIWDEAEEILSRYGTAWQFSQIYQDYDRQGSGPPSSLSLTLLARSESRRLNFLRLVEDLIEAGVTQPFLRYLPMEPFPWPDIELVRQHTEGSRWADSNYTYVWNNSVGDLRTSLVEGSDWATADQIALTCIVPFRLVSQQEYDRYWRILSDASNLLEGGEVSGFQFLPGRPGFWASASPDWIARPIRAGHPSYDAVAHFGRHNWPDDFLLAVGSYYGPNRCAGQPGGFSLNVLPRTPFVLVAVLSPQNSEVTLTGIDFLRDPGPFLRLESEYREGAVVDFASQVRLTRERTMLIPLRLDLRYDTNSEPFQSVIGATDRPEEILETLRRLAPDPIEVDQSPYWQITRSAADLPSPESAAINRRYMYGASLAISSVQTDTTTYSVSEPPAAALISGRGLEGGSCPFVSFYNENGVRLGRQRVLVGASSPDLAMSEELLVPAGAVLMRIEEIEPEISYLSEITLNGLAGPRLAVENQALRPGEGLEISIPVDVRSVVIAGYYELL